MRASDTGDLFDGKLLKSIKQPHSSMLFGQAAHLAHPLVLSLEE
jgi:hypothetical protein